MGTTAVELSVGARTPKRLHKRGAGAKDCTVRVKVKTRRVFSLAEEATDDAFDFGSAEAGTSPAGRAAFSPLSLGSVLLEVNLFFMALAREEKAAPAKGPSGAFRFGATFCFCTMRLEARASFTAA